MEENEQSIDLRVLWKVLKDHLLPIAACAVIAAVVGLVLSVAVIPKQYASEATMVVKNTDETSSSTLLNINDINAAQKMVATCQVVFTTNQVLSELQSSFSNFSINELRDMIVIEAVNNTEILRVSVTTGDPQTSKDIATKLTELAINKFKSVYDNGSIQIVSEPELPESHTFPSVPMFVLVGLFIGLVISYIVFLVIEMVDVKVKPDDDLMQLYGIPVFAEIMNFEISDKGSYKYNYYSHSSSESSHKPKPKTEQNTTAAEEKLSDAPAVDKIGDKRKENA